MFFQMFIVWILNRNCMDDLSSKVWKINLLPQYFFKLKIKGRLQYLEKPSYRDIVTDIIRNIATVCMRISCILVIGVVCSLGHEIRSVWRKILDGKCGITKIINPGTWSRSLKRSNSTLIRGYYNFSTHFCLKSAWHKIANR